MPLRPHFLSFIAFFKLQVQARSWPALCCVVALAGCSGYDLKVNERVVYTPPLLFEKFHMEDESLQTCVEQHVQDNKLTAAAELTRLNCSHAGIQSLQGLATFSALTQLRLSHNNIDDITLLGQLTSLVELQLDHNPVQNVAPLGALGDLRMLDLSAANNVDCASTLSLQTLPDYRAPEHCR